MVAMLLSAFGLRTSSTSSEKPVSTTPAFTVPSVPLANSIDPPRELLLRFFQPVAPEKPKQETPPLLTRLLQPTATEKPTPESFLKEEADRVADVLIVAVPDPIQTAFGHWYDHLIDTYSEAMVDAGYTPDRHWLPWENLRRDEKDPKEREKAIGVESFPGVMLFRKTNVGQLKYGVLFVVGETTNVGVNSLALRRAFDLVHELHETKANGDLTIKIVGPLFTGSQLSWYRTIRAWMPANDTKTNVELVSGSANALTPIAENECPSEILGHLSSPSRVRQRTTIVSNGLLTNAALHFLKADFFHTLKIDADITSLPKGMEDVAFLKESNTGFGTAKVQKDNFIDLRYPMHISRLSAVVREENRKRDERLGLVPQGIRASGGDVVRDQITSLGGNVTAALADRIIGDAMAVIRRKEIRHVVIVATDSRDVVFLTHQMHEECPNARIFLTEADMLFVTPENRNDMRGVVIASTYPLYPPNQDWTGRNDRRFFAAQFIQGCFNATCVHLGQDGNLREYRAPNAAITKSTLQTPPIWITTIGENGRFVPLHIFTNVGDPQLYVATAAPVPWEKVSLPLLNSPRIAALIAILICVYVLVRFHMSYWVFEDNDPVAEDLEVLERIGPYRHLCLFATTAVVTPLVMLPDFALGQEYLRSGLLTYCFRSMYCCFVVIWGIAVVRQVLLFGQHLISYCTPRDWQWWIRLMLHIILLIGGPILSLVLCYNQEDSGAKMLFFMDRATGLHAGYSVVIPAVLMAAAFLTYARFALYRDRLSTLFDLKPPFPVIDDEHYAIAHDMYVARTFRKIIENQKRLTEDLGNILTFCKNHTIRLGVTFGIFGPPILFVLGRLRRSWEGWAWDALFVASFVALIAMVIVSLIRFLSGWKILESTLSEIATLPFAAAFKELPPSVAGTFTGFLYNLREKPYRIALTASLWRRFRNTGVLPKQYPASDPIIDAANPEGGAGTVVNELSNRAADVAEWLRQYWPESRIETVSNDEAPKTTPGEVTCFPVSMYHTAATVDPKTRIPDAEQFLAVQTVLYLGIFFVHLRKLAISAIYTMILLLLAATIYPFQPEGLIMTLMAGLAITVSVVIGHVLVQVNRNELISRIAGNEPNKFTPDWTFLWSNLALLAPFALAAAQVSGRLRSVFEPILGLIR